MSVPDKNICSDAGGKKNKLTPPLQEKNAIVTVSKGVPFKNECILLINVSRGKGGTPFYFKQGKDEMQDDLDEIFRKLPKGHDGLEILVQCHDCKKKFGIKIAKIEGEYGYEGGSIYETPHGAHFKCDSCYEKNHNIELKKITYCEVYSRVVGYLRPLSNWNDGKKAEFDKRIMLKPELHEIPGQQILQQMPALG